MMKPLLLACLASAACAPSLQTVEIVNGTTRPIDAIYIYPIGAGNHGASRGTLAPSATSKFKVAEGHVEVMAVSAKIQLDNKVRDVPSATQGLELTHPMRVVFYDQNGEKPSGLGNPDTIGVSFFVPTPGAPTPAP